MQSIDSTMRTLSTSLTEIQTKMTETQKELSTNTRNLDATDTGVLVRIKAQINNYDTVNNKLSMYRSAVETSKAGLSQINTLVDSCMSLAQELLSNPSLNATDFGNLNTQFQSFLTQITTAVSTSSYDGFTFLSSQASGPAGPQVASIQVGPSTSNMFSTSKVAASLYTLGLLNTDGSNINLNTVGAATTALAALQNALTKLGVSSQSLEKIHTTLDNVYTNNLAIIDTYKTASDQVSMPDATELQVQLNQLNNQQSINYYVISQLNTQASAIMQIFR